MKNSISLSTYKRNILNGNVIRFRLDVSLMAIYIAVTGDYYYGFSSLTSINISLFSNFYFLLLCMAIIMVPRLVSIQPVVRDNYPQLRYEPWTVQKHTLNVVTWMIYLFSYEYLLRGVLLSMLLLHFNLSLAIFINVCVYALLHLHKNKIELLLSIPFGFLLCIIVIQMQSFFPAFLLHLLFALNYEWACIRSHAKSSTHLS